MREGRNAEAVRWLDAAIANRPAVQPLLINRAGCREALGDVAGALVDYRSVFEAFRDEFSAIQYVNFVLRHGGPDVCLAAVESALPAVGDDYRCALLASAAAMMARADRVTEAAALLGRALGVGDPVVARATVTSMVEHFGEPRLLGLLASASERPTALGAVR